jgi:hypothetical protein
MAEEKKKLEEEKLESERQQELDKEHENYSLLSDLETEIETSRVIQDRISQMESDDFWSANKDLLDREKIGLPYLMQAINAIGDDDEVVFIGIGAGSQNPKTKEQQIPSYIKEIAKNRKVRILLIDPLITEEKFMRSQENDVCIEKSDEDLVYHYLSPEIEGRLTIHLCSCCIPENNQCGIFSLLKSKLKAILNKDVGQVFIGNHLQAYGLEDLPVVGQFYNFLKKFHGDKLQLYTQGGSGGVLYYQDEFYRPYSHDSDDRFRGKRCKTIENLKDVDCFKIRELKPKSKFV